MGRDILQKQALVCIFGLMMRLFFILFFITNILVAQTPAVIQPNVSNGVRFTENLGQWEQNVLFKADLDGGQMFIEKNKITYNLYDKVKYRSLHQGGIYKGKYHDMEVGGHAFKVEFIGANLNPVIQRMQKTSDYNNYFIGNDQTKWRSNVGNYSQVWLKELFNGIDYELLAAGNGVKYNLHVKPNADVETIKLKYVGAESVRLKHNTLRIKLSVNEVVEQKPYAYQIINGVINEVKCEYKLTDNILSFEIPEGYNKSVELIIDPVIIFAAQSGSTADNFGMTGTYDSSGNLFSGGTVFNVGYPVTTGAYSNVFNGPVSYGNTDVVITKYNNIGTNLLYSTYFGGSGAEIVTSLICDPTGNLYLYGATSALNFPTTTACYDPTFNGGTNISFQFNGTSFTNGTDIYVAKFNNTGTGLLGSTYVGGSSNDGVNYNNYAPPTHLVYPCWAPNGYPLNNEYPADSLQYNYGDQYRGEIQLDKNGAVYIASSTKSSNFPIVGGFQSTLNGKQDAVVFKLNSSLTTMIWSTYLGGSGNDAGYSLIVDDTLQTYVTGGTYSSNFPAVTGCYQTAYNGGKADGYIAKINASGNALLKATYVGTSNYDQSYFVQRDRIGRIYIFGQSLGSMPVSPGIYSNPGSHQFIMRFNNQLTVLDKSTVFGSGTPKIDISPSAFSVDQCSGSISLTGWGGNFINCVILNNMPITPGAFQTTPPNGHDFYFFVLQPNFTALKYGSYFGGNLSDEHVDGGTSRISESGVLYQSICAGCGGSPPGPANQDFPVTPGAWPGTPGNPNHNTDNYNCNNGVVKFDYQPKVTSTIGTNTISGCAPLTVTFTNLSSPGLIFHWNLGGGPSDTTSLITNPVKTFTNPGTYTVTLKVVENVFCNTSDSSFVIINVYPKPNAAFAATLAPCNNTVTTTNNSTGNLNSGSYTWNWGDASSTSSLVSPSHTYSSTGVYTITLFVNSVNGCTAQTTQTVNAIIFNPSVSSAILCEGNTATLSALGGTSYTWSPSTGLSNSLIATPAANPSVTTGYTVTVFNNSSGFPCTSTLTTTVVVNPRPDAGFNYTMNPCGGGVNFFDTSLVNISSWKWYLAPSVTSTAQNPYNFYSNGGSYTISLAVVNAFGCTDSISKIITVQTPPPMSVNSGSTICKGKNANLIAAGGTSYSWTPSTGLSATNIANPVSSATASTNYSVIITTSNNCSFLLTTFVNVFNLSNTPISAASNPTSVIKGNSSTLTYTGDPGAGISWFPSASVNPKTGYTVTATPDRPTTYTVIASRGACKETLYVFVDVFLPGCEEGDAFIPNTFTPNGDGQNDILYVRGLKVEEVYFAVYNRWGEMVFETTDKNKGWDGIYKGRPADVGVFGWYLKVKCYNGEETFKKGNVTLIR